MIGALGLFLVLLPLQDDGHLKQGLLALNTGDLSKAQQELEQAEQRQPDNAFVWAALAQTYLRLQNEDKAETAAAKAAQLDSRNPVVIRALGIFYFEYAQILLRKEDFTRAAAVLEDALKVDGANAQLVLALGVARYGQRRFEEAIESFLKVITIDPAIEQSYIFLGKMLDQAGARLPEIIKDDRAWVARASDNPQAPLELAKAVLANDARASEATGLLERSIELNPNNWESHYQLGVVLEAKHDYGRASAELERATQLDPKQAMPHYHLARVYDRLGKPEQAKAERDVHARLTCNRPQ